MNHAKALITTAILFLLPIASIGQVDTRHGSLYTNYGLNQLSSWQSLRLTMINPRYSDSEIIPCIKVRVVVDFYEVAGDGSVKTNATRRVVREMELDPGEASSIDVPATLACDGSVCPAARSGAFVGVSVFATPVEGATPDPVRWKFNSTLALREFGRTAFTLPAVEKGFDPQPDPPAIR